MNPWFSKRLSPTHVLRWDSLLRASLLLFSFCAVWLALGTIAIAPTYADLNPAQSTPVSSVYSTRARHSPDGIGKFYMGREIAQVMGHPGAGWLERSTRKSEEQPDRAVRLLDLRKTDVVADIGAGTGYFTFRIAPRVSQVYAVDIQQEMLDIIERFQQKNGLTNITKVLGNEADTRLPAGTIDLALMVDAYHEFSYPKEMMESIGRGLKPGGRVALVEYKAENPLVLIKRLHKMSEAQVRLEMEAVGLTFVENKPGLPQQHLLIFRKP